ncbi:GNAT family N-acetyltransferase [Euzebya sp.]|uniref:bifunctional acetate--CoA ligase family protein/GNAT family N-acetyltransferase n=1 Tax=Euzebya sp. TaxID=1971409 RepID=UPI00351446CB
MTTLASAEADHLLPDGTTIHVRPPRQGDVEKLRAMWDRLSPTSIRYRFGGAVAIDRAPALLGLEQPDGPVVRVATTGSGRAEQVVALAQLAAVDESTAEFAALVEDAHQGRGIGTVLLRELTAIAREEGRTRIVAEVQASNVRMLRVIHDLGVDVVQHLEGTDVHATFDVHPTESYLAAIARDEQVAARQALRRFLQPRRIAVIGATGDTVDGAGAVAANLRASGFTGAVYVVDPSLPADPSDGRIAAIEDCPHVPDLLYVCLPAPEVPDAVERAGRFGVRAAYVASGGFLERGAEGAALQADLLDRARAHGMRVIGPNGVGLVNTAVEVRLNATTTPGLPPAGRVALASQSGAVTSTVLRRAEELGLGVSSAVSLGGKADVSGNDLLLSWEQDPGTAVVLAYLESFGNPRRFARIARRIARTKPIAIVKAVRGPAAQRAATGHRTPVSPADPTDLDGAVEALCRQAGVIRTGTLEELLDVGRLLGSQPLPRGRRIAVVTDGGGPGAMAADALEAAGLVLPELDEELRSALAAVLCEGAGTANPIDLLAGAGGDAYRQAIELVGASGQVDAVVAITSPPAARVEDVAQGIASGAEGLGEDVAAVAVLFGPEQAARRTGGAVPWFRDPADAARALGRAAVHAEWRRRPLGTVVRPEGVDVEGVRRDLRAVLAAHPEGTWLQDVQTADVLDAYGVRRVRTRRVTSAAEASLAQRELDAPVAVKIAAPVAKQDLGAVVLGCRTAAEAHEAVGRIDAALATRGRTDLSGAYLVQEMVTDGVEVAVRVVHDRSFGPVVTIAAGGPALELVGDVAVGITPLTDVDIDDMLTGLRTYPLLTGYRGAPPADVAALRDLLFRISALVEDVPEIAELDINPVFVRPEGHGVTPVDVRIRLAPPAPAQPL